MKSSISNELSQDRQALSYGARLHWFHWMILVLSGMLTIAAWYFSKSQIEERAGFQFEREATQAVALVSERLQKYEDALWSGVAAIQASDGDMSYAEWHKFAKSLQIDTKYTGINGLGVIRNIPKNELVSHVEIQRRLRPKYQVHPEHSAVDSFPIVYIEPEAPNAKAVGLDVAHETNRYTAAKKARDTGLAQITGPIVLVQDTGQTPGFLLYAPYYAGGTYSTESERRENFLGMVYAPFVVHQLMAGTLEKDKRHVGIGLSDGKDALYDEHNPSEADFDENPLFTYEVDVATYGRTWTFDIWSTKSFREATANSQPTFILAGGIVIDLLLLTLFLMLSRASRRSLSFADRMTVELKRNATELARSNAELESFAYVTSHDLKTPLRGIADLTSYLEEDLEQYMSAPDACSDVQYNLKRINQQVDRMNNLIKGILDYSGVGSRSETLETVDIASLLASLRTLLGIREDQLVLQGSFPAFLTYKTRLEQVMNNLIGNAFKYHHDPVNASVRVSCSEGTHFFAISVADNGPGIDPKFHGRIFEVFQTLQSRDEIESSGVGLSIVKKSVEILGGEITITSEIGKGTTFRFEWPKVIQDELKQASMVS